MANSEAVDHSDVFVSRPAVPCSQSPGHVNTDGLCLGGLGGVSCESLQRGVFQAVPNPVHSGLLVFRMERPLRGRAGFGSRSALGRRSLVLYLLLQEVPGMCIFS